MTYARRPELRRRTNPTRQQPRRNRAVDWLRTPRGPKWVFPVAVVATPAYIGAMAGCIHLATRPGLGWLNGLVFLFLWTPPSSLG